MSETIKNTLTVEEATILVNQGSTPTTPSAGQSKLYAKTDKKLYFLNENTTATQLFPLHTFTQPPVVASFTFVNQGSATAIDDQERIFLKTPGAAATQLRILKKAIPAVPYVITVALLPVAIDDNNPAFGLLFRESSSSKLEILEITRGANPIQLEVNDYTDESTLSGNVLSVPFALSSFVSPLFLRIADDNTNRVFSISADGRNFIQFTTVPRTTFLTADEIGFFVAGNNSAAYDTGLTLVSWLEA